MKIEKLWVSNFKSLVNFELEIAKFTCLIGLNGSGKSTVLQFMDFLGRQMRGDLVGWFKERNWEKNSILTKLSSNKTITFEVQIVHENGNAMGTWRGRYNPQLMRCTKEDIYFWDAELSVSNNVLRILEKNESADEFPKPDVEIQFSYEGSILSQLREDILPESLREFKLFFENIKSLDLLSPELLRKREREAGGSLGVGGQKLSAFLNELGVEKRKHLLELLQRVYPELELIHISSLRAGWKKLEIIEKYEDKTFTTEARHINDGMLRLMAILAELQTNHSFVLFDEIENGINAELMEFLLDVLVNAEQQVLVTTHSPMILNYMDDEIARAGVMYLYKNSQGITKSKPFFEIPSLAKKLTVMGPGEAFVDTDLNALCEEINEMP